MLLLSAILLRAGESARQKFRGSKDMLPLSRLEIPWSPLPVEDELLREDEYASLLRVLLLLTWLILWLVMWVLSLLESRQTELLSSSIIRASLAEARMLGIELSWEWRRDWVIGDEEWFPWDCDGICWLPCRGFDEDDAVVVEDIIANFDCWTFKWEIMAFSLSFSFVNCNSSCWTTNIWTRVWAADLTSNPCSIFKWVKKDW